MEEKKQSKQSHGQGARQSRAGMLVSRKTQQKEECMCDSTSMDLASKTFLLALGQRDKFVLKQRMTSLETGED
jgi:hypothetical protein